MNIATWLIYGILAALCWGSYAVVAKVVTSEEYFDIHPWGASLLMLGGIFTVFMLYFLSKARLPISSGGIGVLLMIVVLGYIVYSLKGIGVRISLPVVGFGFLQGALWALGMVFAFLAFSIGAEAAKLVPIYNTNTLIAVFLGLILLHEVPAPDVRLKVIIGAVLIVIGGILVSS